MRFDRPGFLVMLFLLPALIFFFEAGVFAHVEHAKDPSKDLAGIGIDEKAGQYIPLDLIFKDETGKAISLRELLQRPTLLALVYLHCPNVCGLMLQNIADALNRLPADPEKDYRVLAVSFDEREKPGFALERKKIYLKMIERPFPEGAWRFLTGDKENIQKLADSVGFHFKRVGEDFEHPVALIVLAADGKIIRYMYGAYPLPFDVKLALLEASQGRIGPAIRKVVRFCFSYDPKADKLVFNTLKVTGAVTLLFALSFVVFLLFKGRNRSFKEEHQE